MSIQKFILLKVDLPKMKTHSLVRLAALVSLLFQVEGTKDHLSTSHHGRRNLEEDECYDIELEGRAWHDSDGEKVRRMKIKKNLQE